MAPVEGEEESKAETEATTTGDESATETSGATDTSAATTTAVTTADESGTSKRKRKKKKGKRSKSRSKSKKRKRKKKSKKKKKKKKKTKSTSGGEKKKKPEYSEDDVQMYLEKKEQYITRKKLKRLLYRMKELVCLIDPDDLRYNQLTEEPLRKFINEAEVQVVTIHLNKREKPESARKVLWDKEKGDGATDRTSITEAKKSGRIPSRQSAQLETTSTLATKAPLDAENEKGGGDAKSKAPERPSSPWAIFEEDEEAEKLLSESPQPLDISDEELVVSNEILGSHSPDVFFFVKRQAVVLTRENFFDIVAFGNIPGGCLNALQFLLSFVYSPIMYSKDVLPDSIRGELFDSFNKVMGTVTEAFHRMYDQTVLHVPKEVLNMPVDVASKDRELCARLEDTMIHWIRQIKDVLLNQIMPETDDFKGPLSELAFWEATSADLASLTAQIRGKAVRRVIEIMKVIKSPYVDQFLKVAEEILESSAEAISNLHYLSLLKEPFQKLQQSTVAEISEQLQNILWMVRIIWLNSPYYNTRDKLNGLLRKITNEIISHCMAEINIDEIFQGEIQQNEKIVKECLNCCQTWKTLYFEAEKMHSMNSHLTWLLEYDYIFSHLDAFIQRLKDLLEICTCQILYGRRRDGQEEVLPLYPGIKANDLTRVMTEVQKSFDELLIQLYPFHESILDVRTSDWLEHMAEFRASTRDLEIMIQNALTSAFEYICNVEQGIQLLETFYNFYKRNIITRTFDKLTLNLYKLFERDLSLVAKFFSKNILPLPLVYPMKAGRAAWAMFMRHRLQHQRNLLSTAWWLPECGYGEDIKAQSEALEATLDQFAGSMFNAWEESVCNIDHSDKLNIPLMRRSTNKTGMIEVNFPDDIHELLIEAEMFGRLGYEIPEEVKPVFSQKERLHHLREMVMLVVKDYNRIIASLSPEERSLFKERIKLLDRKIYPGLTKLTWASDVSDAYINDCRQTANKVQGFTNDYKLANQKIGKIASKISNLLMVKMDVKRLFEGIEFSEFQARHREKAILKIAAEYRDVTLILKSVHEVFKGDGAEVKIQWVKYLKTVDEVVEEALSINLKRSLEILLRGVAGDYRGPPPPIFKVNVVLDENKLGFEPSISLIRDMLAGIYDRICDTLQPLPRVVQFLGDRNAAVISFSEALQRNQAARLIQADIEEAVANCIAQIEQFLKIWEPYKDLWEIDKDEFMKHYETLEPTVETFDADINQYNEIASSVFGVEGTLTMLFVVVDCNTMKESIADHCRQWKERLCSLLFDQATSQLQAFYKYMTENTEKFQDDPKTVHQLVTAFKLFRGVQAEIPVQEAKFPKMNARFAVLKKHEYELGDYMTIQVANFPNEWAEYLQKLKAIDAKLKAAKEKLRQEFLQKFQDFLRRVEEFIAEVHTRGPYSHESDSSEAMGLLDKYMKTRKQLVQEEKNLVGPLAIFEIDVPPNQPLREIEDWLKKLQSVWELVFEWDMNWDEFRTAPFKTMQTGEMEDVATHILKKLYKVQQDFEKYNWDVIDHTIERIEVFKRSIPVIHELKNPALRERHWKQIFETIHATFDPEDEKFTFEVVVSYGMERYADEIADIVSQAQKELIIEKALATIREYWETQILDIVPYKNTKHFKLRSVQEMLQNLEDHVVSISTMKGSRFAKPFAAEIKYWENTTTVISEVLDLFLNVQRQWLYLENIFHGDDIRKQLPKESGEFDSISREWLIVTSTMAQDKLAIPATHRPGLPEVLAALLERLELILKRLELFLEAKRQQFPRFYFISNEDMLDILGNSRNPEMVQPHFKKLFDNINKVKLRKLGFKFECLGMTSSDGEYVEFLKPLKIEGPVENWLTDIESNMRATLKHLLRKTRDDLRKNLNRRDTWIKNWPGQTCITAAQIEWTTLMTRALYAAGDFDLGKNPVKHEKKRLNKVLNKYSLAVRGDLTKVERAKITAMVTIEIHARDVADKLFQIDCRDMNAFEWLQQLRFYWEKQAMDCFIRQTNTHFQYGHEYLGNSGRLAITPLTERCYVTLTTALFLHRGGSPKGPAGTGKTETVKDLGKNLGMYVIVINCSEGLDYKSMGKMFAGVAQITNCWLCFDEFNRISVEVLSVVAQQVMSILQALAANMRRFVFEGQEIKLHPACGIFVTMNPGYAGRTELPDNLKAMFRPISMMVPDAGLIAEITLFSEGFSDVRNLARKVDTLYNLAKQQLSIQDHYDFGLRSMVALLRYAGAKRRVSPNMTDVEVLILAMRDMNIPRLTADDTPLFNGVIRDLFPNEEPPEFDYGLLLKAIKKTLERGNYQPTSKAVRKVLELYETKNSRHSVMLIGRSGSGKSVTWKVLRDSMTYLYEKNVEDFVPAKEFVINPKALNQAELYGEFDLSTGEWSDGVISSIMRHTCADEKPDQKWILFDGPVDSIWIENMNSVMDDNKILTLINSERISMPPQVTLLFEVDNLTQASPATVSRCGMVYTDYKDLGWKPYIDSWIQGQPKKKMTDVYAKHVEQYLIKTIAFKAENCTELIPTTELNNVISLTRLMDTLCTKENGAFYKDSTFEVMSRLYFIFSLIWSVCATVNDDGRHKLDGFLREMDPIFPAKGTIYDYFVDHKSGMFVDWATKLDMAWTYDPDMPYFKIVVPTVDTIRYNFVVSTLLKNSYPALLVGPVGTGKTSVVQAAINDLDRASYLFLTINMSSQTTSPNVQNFIESRLEKRARGVFTPPEGKYLLTFMDDLNMPAKDAYGSQPPLELLRQWLDYQFWYDRKTQAPKFVQNMLLVGAMGPPGGGRKEISNRLLNVFSVINMTFPEAAQVKRIFLTMLNQKVENFEPEIKALTEPITTATIELYESVSAKLLPTPSKIHYLFNLRDISRVYQGLLRSNKKSQDTKIGFLKLWFHECLRVFHDRLTNDVDREWFTGCLAEKLGANLNQTLQSVCPNRIMPVFGNFMNKQKVYEDIRDRNSLAKFLIDEALPRYNSTVGNTPMNLVLFREAIEHIARINRVITQPKGNMMVVGIGGHGRQSLSKLASSVAEYNIFELEVNRRYGKQEFREDIKKIYSRAGRDNRTLSFIMNDTQIVDEAFLEDINNILSTGEVPNLYKPDEFEDIKASLTKPALRAGYQDTNESIFQFLLDRVQSNLHVILCMSPVGENFRQWVRQYPALVNNTTIDWFDRWPKTALLEVANNWLSDVHLDDRSAVMQDEMKSACASMFANIHFGVEDYCDLMKKESSRINYVTPINFLDTVSGYRLIVAEKKVEFGDACKKLKNGLAKLIETRKKVEDISTEVETTQHRVAEFQEECDKVLEMIIKQKTETDVQAVIVQQKRERVAIETKECDELAKIAYAELAEALPALDEAIKALEALNKKDVAEVKSYVQPPKLVAKVMEAVMILKGLPPTWKQAKQTLGDADFLKSLINFPKEKISSKTLGKLQKYIDYKDFIPELVQNVSVAATAICIWVRAIHLYGTIYNAKIAPKKARLEEAEAILREKQAILAAAEKKIRELEAILAELRKNYEDKMALKEELERKADILKRKLERAKMLVSGLAGERKRWEEGIKLYEKKLQTVIGDCLLSAACMGYIGPFLSNYREQMIRQWLGWAREMGIPVSSNYNFCEFLADPTSVREWNIWGLPRDSFSTENGVIVTRGKRTALMIDPQAQALKWIKNMESVNKMKVIDLMQADYLQVLEDCITSGVPVILKDVGEVLDPSLAPVLSRSIVRRGDDFIIKIGDKELVYNPSFRFYITTKMANPHYAPEISSRACIVNFEVKEQGLEEQLLGIVVRKEKPELEEMKSSLVVSIAGGKRKLQELEETILRLLNESQGSILDDEELAVALQVSKQTSETVTKSLQVAQETETEIDDAREHYRPSARRSSILFFVLYDLSRIDPMYQFSLEAYINLFMLSLDKSPGAAKISERISNLNDYHTYAVYRYTCRGLFERHKLLFSFHICVKILLNEGKIDPEEYQYFLRGGIVLNRSEQMDNPCAAWLSEIAWDNITELDKLESFRGLTVIFEQLPKEWHEWYKLQEPETSNLPGDLRHKLDDFQKMMIIRALRPDRVSVVVAAYISNNLGTKYTEPPVLDMESVLEDSTCLTPLLFVLSPGADPASALFALADSNQMMRRFQSLSLGQGQTPMATKMIEEGAMKGNWVFLANCHLSISWMPQFGKLVEIILESGPHKDFRLWLSSSPHPKFPLSILQAGLKMTTEPPTGIKANMKRLYLNVQEDRFHSVLKPEKYRKLVYCLSFFHAILLERKKFQQLGWNIIYGFNDSDFEVSDLLLGIYLGEYDETPWEALKYLIAGVMYGGHVTDDWDRRLLMTYINHYFRDEAINQPLYKLTTLPSYFVPRDGDLRSYKEAVSKLPATDHPEVFGQHTNADIASQINDANLLFSTLLSMQQTRATKATDAPEEKVSRLAADILFRLPAVIDEVETKRVLGEAVEQPLNIVLLQEISRYNVLLENIRKSLVELDKGIQGLVVMSAELEEIFSCILDGRVPPRWLKAYPSLKPLGSWSRDLTHRVEQFVTWATTMKPPVKFWLSGFTFPTGFLTAVLQTFARKYSISVDSINWDFFVSTVDAANILLPPKDGAYIQGLFLEGASWDKQKSCLIESQPMQLVTQMPVIHFKPVANKNTGLKNIYECPCYYYPDRAGAQGRQSFVVAVDLRTGVQRPEHWVQRGVALLMSLNS